MLQEGLIAGQKIAARLGHDLEEMLPVPINHGEGIKMTSPGMVRVGPERLNFRINLHVTKAYSGPITVSYNGKILYQKSHNCLPTRRISLKNIQLKIPATAAPQQIDIVLGA